MFQDNAFANMLPNAITLDSRGFAQNIPEGISEIKVDKRAPKAPTNFFAYNGRAYKYCGNMQSISDLGKEGVIGVLPCGDCVVVFTELKATFLRFHKSNPRAGYSTETNRVITDYYAANGCCLHCSGDTITLFGHHAEVFIPVRYSKCDLEQMQIVPKGDHLVLPENMSLEGNIQNFTCTSLGKTYNITLFDGTQITIDVNDLSPSAETRTRKRFYNVSFRKVAPRVCRIVYPIPLMPCSDEECRSYEEDFVLKFAPPERCVQKSARK